MRHAEHHGFPILTFIDTPGAYAGVSAEELGQVRVLSFHQPANAGFGDTLYFSVDTELQTPSTGHFNCLIVVMNSIDLSS